MSVRLGLLALLDQGACYGYQLRTELDRRTGSTGPINVGQIYNTLDRLERDKLVRKTGERNYYEITAAGRTEVATWFSSPASGSELVEKLALAVTLPGVDVASLVAIQRAATNRDRPLRMRRRPRKAPRRPSWRAPTPSRPRRSRGCSTRWQRS
ncbi:MAG: PadR family transcriptional regulator [Galbitalea sp.]